MRLKSTISLLLFTLINLGVIAQNYGNEWIDYTQKYYTFKIVNDGFYRLTYEDLSNAGIPLTTFQADNIQIFGKERELPLHIVDQQSNNALDPGDYILFYAEGNDSWLDSLMYEHADHIGNPGFNLYNDTLVYFFTWNSSSNNNRFAIETDVNYGSYTSANYIWSTIIHEAHNTYYEGYQEDYASSSLYTAGEGWGENHKQGANNPSYSPTVLTFSTLDPYTGAGAPDAYFTGRSVSNSNADAPGMNHHARWHIGSNTIFDYTWLGYNQARCNVNFSSSLLTNGNTLFTYSIVDDLNATTDYQAYQFAQLRYPQVPDLNSANKKTFEVINDPQGKIRVDLANNGTTNPFAIVLGSTPRIIPFEVNGGSLSGIIPNSSNGLDQTVILSDSSLITNVTTLSAVNGNGSFTDFSALNYDNSILMVYHPSLSSSVQSYSDYRAISHPGNPTHLANIEELYLQFGGGIIKHIYGIRRFAHYAYNNASSKPASLFLIGKGINDVTMRKYASPYSQNLVPAYGTPSSDVAITSGLSGIDNWSPLIPIGRISVKTDEELLDYLDKVQRYETNQNQFDVYDTPNKDWQKQVLHFSGGSNAQEHQLFQYYMNALSDSIVDSLFAGNVHKIYKTDSNPLDPAILGNVTDRISDGVSLMTYFGHNSGSNSGFEINLDEPENWNNSEKYPVMLVNSCYNGNIFLTTGSKSEEFVQIPEYGAIAYIATVSVGVSNYLFNYSNNFYSQACRKNYGKTLGELMQMTTRTISLNNSLLGNEATTMQMTLNGDPMLKLNWHSRPEIELTPDDVSFYPSNIDLSVDSIEMKIALTNLGVSVTDTFILEVTRNFPNSNTDSVYTFFIPYLHYMDTVTFKMPLQANIGIGQNNFTIRADLPSYIQEQYDEITNNEINVSLMIDIESILPVLPYEFAVVPDSIGSVIASTLNPISPFNTYRFEIDTVDFEGTVPQSSEYRYAMISDSGGVFEVNYDEWLSVATGDTTPLIYTDSTVYFWRVSIFGDSIWNESSFQYIPGKTGWGQDHFYQFKKNSFSGLAYDRVQRLRNFSPVSDSLLCGVSTTLAWPDWWYDNYSYLASQSWTNNGIGQGGSPKIMVVSLDPITLEPMRTGINSQTLIPYPCYGNNNCNLLTGDGMEWISFLATDSTQLAAFQNFVTNIIPDSNHLLIYTPRKAMHSYWDISYTDIYNTFATLGSDSVIAGRLSDNPFIFYVKKGDVNTVFEQYVQAGEVNINANIPIYGVDDTGAETSTLIGPASNWNNVYWKQDSLESPSYDSITLYITGHDISGTPQFSTWQTFTPDDSLLNLNSIIDAATYPYISLKYEAVDSLDKTPAQVDRWHVLYTPLPEAAIDGNNGYYWSATGPVDEGEQISFAVDVRNIFNIDMDSLKVDYWILNKDNVKVPINYPRQDSLRVGETLRDTITFSTVGIAGANSFMMEVNPYINGSFVITDQPEQEHFNNLLQIPFIVNPDDEHPILDVTFNGNHILNGDIIDPYSEVLITLKDENPLLVMDSDNDTTLFGIYLTDPSGNQERIPFMDADLNVIMQWIPANSQNKRFKIIWDAAFETDGVYTLSVQGADKSGNLSGDLAYEIDFEIIRESTITAMMNYPNPFSTSTRFVFTLTGSEVPDDILIQILNVSGKVVREINEDELGPIQIGRNITEFAWDGTDNFGDPLANGVYLYRVKTKINGEDIKHRETGADQYFTKDFGKMYLLR